MQGPRSCPYPWHSPQSGEYVQEPHWCPPTHGMGTAPLSTDLFPPLGKGLQEPIFNLFTEQQPTVAEPHLWQFHNELAAVQQTSDTLHLGNRNHSH